MWKDRTSQRTVRGVLPQQVMLFHNQRQESDTRVRFAVVYASYLYGLPARQLGFAEEQENYDNRRELRFKNAPVLVA
jgi:hypothetical protein